LNDVHKVDNVNLYADNFYEYSIDGSNWQTATTFSAPVGTYTVQARPICGTSCVTNLGTVTLTSATLDWANTQWPPSGEICQGGAFNVYVLVLPHKLEYSTQIRIHLHGLPLLGHLLHLTQREVV
jgi:hypothetical protein